MVLTDRGDSMKELSKAELKELLIKCWMTHDAMWLMQTVQHCGFEKANLINKAAVRSMAQVEIKRIKKALALTGLKRQRLSATCCNISIKWSRPISWTLITASPKRTP